MDFRFEARGHAAVLSTHATTLEITRERDLTDRGNCVVAVGSSIGLKDLPTAVKRALANNNCKARLTFEIGDQRFSVEGQGDTGLTFSHPTDFVIRKSGFVSDRTLMVHANRSAADIPRPFVRLLQDPAQKVLVRLLVQP
jgi:uncharacterized protein